MPTMHPLIAATIASLTPNVFVGRPGPDADSLIIEHAGSDFAAMRRFTVQAADGSSYDVLAVFDTNGKMTSSLREEDNASDELSGMISSPYEAEDMALIRAQHAAALNEPAPVVEPQTRYLDPNWKPLSPAQLARAEELAPHMLDVLATWITSETTLSGQSIGFRERMRAAAKMREAFRLAEMLVMKVEEADDED